MNHPKHVIWKYGLALAARQTIEMPRNPAMRAVRAIGGAIYLWAEVNPDAPMEAVDLQIVGTGHREIGDGHYIGTVFMDPYVWHLFYRLRESPA